MKPSRRILVPGILLVLVAVLAGCGSAVTTGTDTSGTSSGNTAGFPVSASHPKPVDNTFQGCPPQGDGGDAQLNVLKNRIDNGEHGTFHDVALGTLIGLQWPQGIQQRQRSTWSSADASAVAQYEGVAVRTTGYLVDFRHEGTESPNCHSVDERDYHMWIVAKSSDGKAQSMVVEVAPRVHSLRPGWTDSAFAALRGKPVRISGWLMMDQEHPDQIGKTRATIYEIHPILHIEVQQGSTWTSIDG